MSGAANRLDGRFWFDGTPFKAEENVGTGAYGVVCKARDTINNTKVAIKKIPRAFAADTIAKRTLREIRILRNLLHENIISVIDMFTAQGVLGKDIYLVMDLMETDLHQILHSRQNLEEQHFQYFLYQLLRGLKYLHSAGIIHRDLKPSNLLLNSDCLLRIADFGMARFIGEPSSSERIDDIKDGSLTQYVSTRWYRAPEILFSLDDYDTKADIWSAGCIFGEMLLRRQLFPGRDGVSQVKMLIYFLGTPDDQLMEKIQSDTIKEWIISCNKKDSLPFSAIFPKASEQARDMISKMLQISPWKRSTASQILEHPFLSLYHNEEYEPLCSSRVKTDISAIENYQGDAILENLFEEERIFEKKRGRKYTTRKSPPPKISEDCEQSIIIDKEGHGPRCDPTDHFGIKNFAEDQKSCYSNSSTETIGTVRHLSSTSQKEGEQFINQRKPNIFSNGINWPLDEACSSSAPPILNKGANYPRDRNHRRIIEKKVADRIRDECIERRIPKLREKRSNVILSDSSSIEDKETYAHAKMKRSRQDLRQCTQDDERRTNKIAL